MPRGFPGVLGNRTEIVSNKQANDDLLADTKLAQICQSTFMAITMVVSGVATPGLKPW